MSLVPLRRNAHSSAKHLTTFLPTTREEMAARGWDEIDILIVNGDAYVDHPAFGGALIGRFLEPAIRRSGASLASSKPGLRSPRSPDPIQEGFPSRRYDRGSQPGFPLA